MRQALKFRAVVRGKTLSLPDLGAFEGKQGEVIVVKEEPEIEAPRVVRRFGTMAGQFVVPDDFDDPLPEEVLAAFEGGVDPRRSGPR